MQAISISTNLASLLTGAWPLHVHSAFDRVVNLELSGAAPWDGAPPIIALARAEVGNLPTGALLGAEAPVKLDALIHQGERGALRGGQIILSELVVDLRRAERWDPRLDGGDEPWAEGWAARWAAAHKELAAVGPGGLGALALPAAEDQWAGLLARGRPLVAALLAACAAGDAGAAGDAAEGLIGLGPGHTPSGDDLLMGLLAGLWSHPPNDERRAFIAALGGRILAAAHRTTDMSRIYLSWAARGHVTERVKALAQAITRAAPEPAVREAAHRALAVGQTSGADGVYGLLAGLNIWRQGFGVQGPGAPACASDARSFRAGPRTLNPYWRGES